MKLSVKERILISKLYPREGNLMTQTLVKDIIKKVELKQDYLKKIDFKSSPQGFTWDSKKAKDINFDFTDSEVNLLKNEVDKLDKGNKITQEILDLCLKIKNYSPSKK